MSDELAPDILKLWPVVVHAGFPSPGEEFAEPPLHLHDLLVRHPLSTYFVRVRGVSMQGAAIYEGDVLVVDRSLTPAHNQIVIVRVDGHLMIKRIQCQNHQMVVQSDPPDGPPLSLGSSRDIEIWGVATYCIHGLL